MPVRLDPWQNIVGVGWSTTEFPAFVGFVHANSGNDPRVTSFEINIGLWNPGDLILVQVSTGDADPVAITTFSGPAGWNLVDQRYMSGGIRLNERLGTDSLWSRFMEVGDSSLYTWTADQNVQFLTVASRISGARQVGFPAAIAFRPSDTEAPGSPGSASDVPFVPGIITSTPQNLLLMLMGVAGQQAQATRYVPDPAFPLQIKAFHRSMSMTPFSGLNHTVHLYRENWPDAGATGDRTISTFATGFENVWHLAIAPA